MVLFFAGSEASAQQRPNPCPPGVDYCHVREGERESYRVYGGQPPRGGPGYGNGGGYYGGGVIVRTPDVNLCFGCTTQVQPQYPQYPPQGQYRGGGYQQGYATAPPPQCAPGYYPGMTPNGPGCIAQCPQGTVQGTDPYGRPICRGRRW